MDSNQQQEERVQHVDIILKPDKIIRIDSVTLRRCSGYFDKSLSSFWLDRSSANVGGSDSVIVYELDLGGVPEEDFLMLKSLKKDSDKQEDSVNNQTRSDHYYAALENLFKIFLHQSPTMPYTKDVIAVVRLGDKYDCLQVVSGAVKASLFEYGSRPDELHRRTLESPMDYLWIGEKIKSDTITLEASVHVIGRWSELSQICKTTVSGKLHGSLAKSYALLRARMFKANVELLALNFDDEGSSHSEEQRRQSALSTVRESISNSFRTNQKSLNPELLAGTLYRDIAAAQHFNSNNYFLTSTLTGKVQIILSGLIVTAARLPSAGPCPTYLLCMKLKKEELPWHNN